MTYTLQPNQTPHFRFYISRSNGWTDLTEWAQKINIKSGNADGAVGSMSVTLMMDGAMTAQWSSDITIDSETIIGNDTDSLGDSESLAEIAGDLAWQTTHDYGFYNFLDKRAPWNYVNGQYEPLLADCKEVAVYIAFTNPGESAPPDGDPRWQPAFYGVLGDDIDTEGPAVTINARDLARYLMDTMIEEEREYSPNGDYSVEAVLQQVINDWWDDGTPPTIQVLLWDQSLKTWLPGESGMNMNAYKPEPGKSLWDICKECADRLGWFVGYWPAADGTFQLSLVQPSREKTIENVDIKLDWIDNVYTSRLNLNSDGIRNTVRVQFVDSSDKLLKKIYPMPNADAIVVEDPAGNKIVKTDAEFAPYLKSNSSIAAHRRRVAWLSEGATSDIDTLKEAVNFGNLLVHDLEEYNGTWSVDMPLCPELRLFDVLSVNDPTIGLDHSQMFGVVEYEHTIDVSSESQSFRTKATCLGKVVGGYTRWHRMETRPGSANSNISGSRIKGSTPPAPTGLSVKSSGVESVGQNIQSYVVLGWDRPAGVSGETYVLEVQQYPGTWGAVQRFICNELTQKLILPGNMQYQARVACISREGAQGGWSDITDPFLTPKDTSAPPKPLITAEGIINGIAVSGAGEAVPDFAFRHVIVGTTSGFDPDKRGGYWNNDVQKFGAVDGYSDVGYADASASSDYVDIFTDSFQVLEFPEYNGPGKYYYMEFWAKGSELPSWESPGEWITAPTISTAVYQKYVLRSDGQNPRREYFRLYFSPSQNGWIKMGGVRVYREGDAVSNHFGQSQVIKQAVGRQTRFEFAGLASGSTYYVKCRDWDTSNNASPLSDEKYAVAKNVGTSDLAPNAATQAYIDASAMPTTAWAGIGSTWVYDTDWHANFHLDAPTTIMTMVYAACGTGYGEMALRVDGINETASYSPTRAKVDANSSASMIDIRTLGAGDHSIYPIAKCTSGGSMSLMYRNLLIILFKK